MHSTRGWLLALAGGYALLLLAASTIPMDAPMAGLDFVVDLEPTIQNLLHIPAYAIFALIILRVLTDYGYSSWCKILVGGFGVLLYGFLCEVIQVYVPGRYFGILDMLLDLIGVALGLCCWYAICHSKFKGLRKAVCGLGQQ